MKLFEYICHMEIKPKLYKLIKRFITQSTKGSDVFIHHGSKWIIFVEDKKWVIELTKEGTLWYNYYFFQNIFELVDLDVVENQHYITKWVEDNVINGVKCDNVQKISINFGVEDTLQNGVKSTMRAALPQTCSVEDTLQNGVKSTQATPFETRKGVEDTIINGVKKSQHAVVGRTTVVEHTIQNGVKETKGEYYKEIQKVEYTIQNGVKETKHNPFEDGLAMEEAIQNGVKETHSGCDLLINDKVEDTIQNGVKHTDFLGPGRSEMIEKVIQNGVKNTYSDKIPHEYDWSNQFTEEIDDIIQNGVKHTEKSLKIYGSCVIEDVIKEGVKHTEYGDWLDGDERFDDIIENGIKETTPGGYLGSVEMKGKTVHQFEHSKQDNDVEEVIQHGVIKTFDETHHRRREVVRTIRDGIKQTCAQIPSIDPVVERVVEEGIKETHDDVMQHTGRVEGVIKNGVKECIPSRTPLYNPMDFSVQYRENHRLDVVEIVLEKGIKEVQPLPAQDGNMDYSNYYYRQGVPTKPHTQYVDDAIRDGVKETWGYEKQPQNRINEVIENGTKENPS
jgi:hypothetical protein